MMLPNHHIFLFLSFNLIPELQISEKINQFQSQLQLLYGRNYFLRNNAFPFTDDPISQVLQQQSINIKVLTIQKMKKIFTILLNIALCLLLLSPATLQKTYNLKHMANNMPTSRHALSTQHKKLVIYHDMRVFQGQHLKNLRHDTAFENYHLNQMGYFFSLDLIIGGLPYSLNIDTGSSDIFIKGEQTPGSPDNKYHCKSCLKRNKRVSIGYLDGFLQTYKAILEVQLGDHKFNQSVLVAYTSPQNFENAAGLLGLSFPQIAQNKDHTFLQTLIDNKIINDYSFGVNLNFQQHNRSYISFGRADNDYFEGNLSFYPLQGSYAYNIQIKGVSIGSSELLSVSSALFDTGNTCISIPEQYTDTIISQFNNGQNSCGFDLQTFAPQFSLFRCKVKNFQSLPSLKIYIGEQIYEIDKDVYIQRCVKSGEDNYCDFYIQTVKYESNLFLGDGFFNRYYTYFDLQKRQIGIAKNKQALSYSYMFKDISDLDDEDLAYFQKL